jgi:hypothetical protein
MLLTSVTFSISAIYAILSPDPLFRDPAIAICD